MKFFRLRFCIFLLLPLLLLFHVLSGVYISWRIIEWKELSLERSKRVKEWEKTTWYVKRIVNGLFMKKCSELKGWQTLITFIWNCNFEFFCFYWNWNFSNSIFVCFLEVCSLYLNWIFKNQNKYQLIHISSL